MYTFIGHPKKKDGKTFVCYDGHIIRFSHPLPLFDDTMYVLLCSRNPTTKEFTMEKCRYWWGPCPED